WKLTASPESMVIPRSIKGLIRARTDQLPADPRRLLQVASVLGEEFNSEVLFQVAADTGLARDTPGCFEELLARGFLHTDRENRLLAGFHHVLARDAVYETILKQNRRYLHSLCARVLSRRFGEDPGLAGSITRHHADAGEIEMAIPWGVKAQDLALARYDIEAVLLWAEKLEDWIRRRLDDQEDARLLEGVLRKRQLAEGFRLDSRRQLETLNRMKDLIEQWDLKDLWAEYLTAMGTMCRRTSEFRQAQEHFEGALEIYRSCGDRVGIARSASLIAKCKSNLGQLRESEEDHLFAVSLFRELGDVENIARSLFRLASTMLLMGRYDEGLEMLDEAIVHARECGNRAIEGNVFGLRGVLQLEKGQYEDALMSQERALAISIEVGDKADELSALNSISYVLYRLGRYDESRQFGLDSLKASREFSNRRAEANILCSLGLVELAMDRNKEALDYFSRSLEIHEEIGRKFAQGALHWNLSLTNYNLLNFQEGLEHAREAIRLYREVGNRVRTASKLALFPVFLIETGRTEEAMACLEERRRDYGDIDDFNIRVQVRYSKGCLALHNEDLEEAERCFASAMDIAGENSSDEYVALSLQNMGLIRLRQGNTAEALDYLRRGCETVDEDSSYRTFLPEAEYFMMTGETEKALGFARKARARAQAAGNKKTVQRSDRIISRLLNLSG
ncbi:MAG: tetratricopeptide repeat protein, partial [Candidatus Fermentibacteraceae bacterium]|nr:tetratricopeptide repeat protein [Candidatus Fermentibacteraceae bacterium]